MPTSSKRERSLPTCRPRICFMTKPCNVNISASSPKRSIMLSPTNDYSSLYASFEWRVPQFYNIGIDTCDKWADGKARLALIHETENGDVQRFSFDDLKLLSAKLGNAWRTQGVEPGERVAIFLAQSPETALAHLAAYKLGAIAVPLFALFGEEALAYRLGDSAASVLVTDREGYAKIRPILE